MTPALRTVVKDRVEEGQGVGATAYAGVFSRFVEILYRSGSGCNLTTGGSAREVMAVLEEHGAKVVACGALLNRSGGNPFEDRGLPLTELVRAEVQVFRPDDCPLCAAGGTAVKPGSREVPAAGGGA